MIPIFQEKWSLTWKIMDSCIKGIYELKTRVPIANCIEKFRELLADSYASVDRHTYQVKKCARGPKPV